MATFTIRRATALLVATLGLGLAACQSQEPTASIVAHHDGTTLDGYLSKPEGDGPFPAVVLQHGCSGLEKNTSDQTVWRGINRHAALLNDNGYVTLIMDSLGPRGVATACLDVLTYYPVLVRDATAAFDYLASQSFVDEERIGYAGFSLGGVSALFVAGSHMEDLKVDRDYAAVVAYYPHCGDWQDNYTFGRRPLLIMIGALDNWTPAALCSDLASHWAGEVELIVYPDTHHSFDLPMGGPYHMKGHDGDGITTRTVAGNPSAARDSQKRMVAFFNNHLSQAH